MSRHNHRGEDWSKRERQMVIRRAGKMLAREIAEELAELGYPERTPGAVRGIIRRHKDKEEGNVLTSKPLPLQKCEPLDANTNVPKIAFFDIESTDLSAGFGELMCFGYWLEHEPEPRVLNMWDYPGWDKLPVERRDFYLIQDVMRIMEDVDVLVGHYSSKFDYPFIQTRCLVHGFTPIPDIIHIDTWRIARYQLKLNNNKLKTVAQALSCDQQKSEVPLHIWRRAKAHDVPAMKIISEYNLQDVRTQRSVSEKILPLAKAMPNRNLMTGNEHLTCPACGSNSLQYRGYSYTKLYKYKRLRCNECGKWMRDRNSITPKDTKRVIH